jgi:hypothetical protein
MDSIRFAICPARFYGLSFHAGEPARDVYRNFLRQGFCQSLRRAGFSLPSDAPLTGLSARTFAPLEDQLIIELPLEAREHQALSFVCKKLLNRSLDTTCTDTGSGLLDWMLKDQGLFLHETSVCITTLKVGNMGYRLNAKRAVFVSEWVMDEKTGETMVVPPAPLAIN